jgi:hypothetical protein
MTRSCVVSFAPGSGGNFIGHVCQYVLYQSPFEIQDNGSCHYGNIINWGEEIPLNDSAQSISNEINEIQHNLPITKKIVVTHCRNLKELSKYFNKLIWISFDYGDVELLAKTYQLKNNNIVYEHSYNNIKDSAWPSYSEFLLGRAEDAIKKEVFDRIYVETYKNWTWIVPADLINHSIYEIKFFKLFKAEYNDVYNLCKFIDPAVDQKIVDYVMKKWIFYKSKQQNLAGEYL